MTAPLGGWHKGSMLRFSHLILILLLVPAMGPQASNLAPDQPRYSGPSGLAIPRFVSLASDTVHMRAGPGIRYPITWVYKRRGTPFMVMAEHEYWRKVRDAEGTEGWIHRSLLSNRRTAVLRGGVADLYEIPDANSSITLRAEPGVIGKLLECTKSWCRIELDNTKAWIPRTAIFGALETEIFYK